MYHCNDIEWCPKKERRLFSYENQNKRADHFGNKMMQAEKANKMKHPKNNAKNRRKAKHPQSK